MPDESSLTLTASDRKLLRRLAKSLPVDRKSLSNLYSLGLAAEVYESAPNANGYPVFSHVTITDKGRRYLQRRKEQAFDRWWTRGLSIFAIIISILALILEFQGRGWLFS